MKMVCCSFSLLCLGLEGVGGLGWGVTVEIKMLEGLEVEIKIMNQSHYLLVVLLHEIQESTI